MIFPFPAGNSRRRRRLKNPGAPAPGFTGVWGRQPPTSTRRVYTGALLAATTCNYRKCYVQAAFVRAKFIKVISGNFLLCN